MTDALLTALKDAARDLPDGWIVEVCVERGAGWVELYDQDGDRHEVEELPDSSLAEQVAAALGEAKRASSTTETRPAHVAAHDCACAECVAVETATEHECDACVAKNTHI
jgi:hypothetical protein